MRTERRPQPSRIALVVAALALALAGPAAGAQTVRAAAAPAAAAHPSALPAPAAAADCGTSGARAGTAAPTCALLRCPACRHCVPFKGCVPVRCPAGWTCNPELNRCTPAAAGASRFAPAPAAPLAAAAR
ncbi:hypothetical protein ACWDR0_09330 [Streptomyces sp. NPDC003691]